MPRSHMEPRAAPLPTKSSRREMWPPPRPFLRLGVISLEERDEVFEGRFVKVMAKHVNDETFVHVGRNRLPAVQLANHVPMFRSQLVPRSQEVTGHGDGSTIRR